MSDSKLEINAPAILLIGKTGAGKSTLGNLLFGTHESENPTFFVSDDFNSVTKNCGSANLKIGDEIYNIVDTPGIFDTDNLDDKVIEEIARTVQNCAYGVKAILFVFEAKRYTEEQRNVINGIVEFLGEESLQYMIAVFSHCNKQQTKDPKNLRNSWNEPVNAFVNSIGNRWAISPDPDIFSPENPVHQQCLKNLQNVIASLDRVYTNELLNKARKKREEFARIAKEAEEKRKKEYDEMKKKEGEAIAKEKYLKQQAADDEKARIAREKELQDLKDLLNPQIDGLNALIEQQKQELDRQKRDLSNQIEGLRGENNGPNHDLCFWLKTRVKLESGGIIEMSKLHIGDRVLSNIRNGIAEFSEVYLIAHIGKLEHEVNFTKVSFTRPDGSKGQLQLTATHYVFNENLSIVFAKDLCPGKTKILVLDDNNKLVAVLVDDITKERYDEYISFYTRAGSVIADGVLCSCYDHCPPSQTLMDLVFLPIRWWTLLMPSMHREERLHPYVKFLETAYLSFINVMKKGKQFIEN